MKLDTLRVALAERLPSDPSNPGLGAGAFTGIQCLGRSEREALVPSSRGADSSPWGDTETWSRVGTLKPETSGRQFSRLDEVLHVLTWLEFPLASKGSSISRSLLLGTFEELRRHSRGSSF